MRIRILLLGALTGASLALGAALAQPQQSDDEHAFDALEGASPDVALVARLLMMKGHLRIGRELYRAGDHDAAQGHFLHPLVELDPEVEPALEARKLEGVKPALEALGNAPDQGEAAVGSAFETANAAVDRALLPAAKALRRSAAESYDLFARIAAEAAHEYANGIEGETVIAPVEYQDARGFLLAGAEALKGFAQPLAIIDEDGYRTIEREYQSMLSATPTAQPPERVEVPPARLEAAVKRIEGVRPLFH